MSTAEAMPIEPYGRNDDHLADELRRINRLVRAQVVRWKHLLAVHKKPADWGMLRASADEVDAYLGSRFVSPGVATQESLADPDKLGLVQAEINRYVEEARQAATRIESRIATGSGAPRLERLRRAFGLKPIERDVLLVCLLPEYDPRYRRLFAYLQDHWNLTRPKVELILQILAPVITPTPHTAAATGRALFQPGAPLLAHGLIVVGDGHQEEPLPSRLVRLDDRIAGYLLGSETVDGRLAGVARPFEGEFSWDKLRLVGPKAESRLRQLRGVSDWVSSRLVQPGVTIVLHGPRGGEQLAAARAIAWAARRYPLLVVDVAKALRSSAGWPVVAAAAGREAILRGAAIYWTGADALLDREQPPQHWDALLAATERGHGLTFVEARTARLPVARRRDVPWLGLEFPAPGYVERRALWQASLPDECRPAPAAYSDTEVPHAAEAQLLDELANGFQLTEEQILDAVAQARWLAAARDPSNPRVTRDDLFEACRRQSGGRLQSLARRIEPRPDLSFERLILPGASKRHLQELRDRVRFRGQVHGDIVRRAALGKGLVALFTGPSGTGKTMAAELLAQEQGVDLYKVDLAAVVSKWVGETEKNLAVVFAEAEDANAVLLFDEADALFSKRGEVKEAHDRWANLEANYLLQRIEEYSGVVILTTNLRQNIDEAFLRRIHMAIDFPMPDETARRTIWLGLLQDGFAHPPDDAIADLARRFNLSGGSIRNIVVDATFRALAEADAAHKKAVAEARAEAQAAGEPTSSISVPPVPPVITLRHLILGTARELQKLNKPITRTEFTGESFDWVEREIFPDKPGA